ncbi:alpha/beta hydrolase [Tundrisphaera sp. TA3]|uniref:alpha/beta hydrolase n=1 Tax=Tundrisphaera sp. TA3 TaxID=3435775 RepID=UPI003EBF70CC
MRFLPTLLAFVALSGTARPADPGASASAVADLRRALGAGGPIDDRAFAAVPLTREDAAIARGLLWDDHVARLRKERAAELEARTLAEGKLSMPFGVTTFGEKPEGGHSLWISLHGGGNAPARVNDGQWANQKRLYKLDEGIYVAPRAPTNTWNLWHEPHIDRLFGRLIADYVALEGVDPDRVYVMGYSAGGDGVYQLAPRMADSWAAAAMMAGHPNDADPLGLRNVPFALQVGGEDAAYDRNKVAARWGETLDDLRKADPGGYDHLVKIHAGKGHWMDREDAAALPWMAKHRRNPTPDRVVWKQAGTTHDRSYWLAVPPGTAKPGTLVEARRAGQSIDIAAEPGTTLLVRLDDRMLDLDQPIAVTHRGKTIFEGRADRTIATLRKTLAGREDPKLMFDAEVPVKVE